jgi:hypothetical protein
VFAGNNKPIFGFLPTIDTANSNAARWAITMNIEKVKTQRLACCYQQTRLL